MANIRDVLNNNSSIVTIVAVVALISALTYIIYSSSNGSRRGGVVSQWYFDENTGQLFAVKGHQYIDNVVLVDQSPIGKTTRSTPATYVGNAGQQARGVQ